MNRKTFGLAVLAGLLFSLPAREAGAQATSSPWMTVDGVEFTGAELRVTGVVEGESTPTTRSAYFLYEDPRTLRAYDACQRALLLALGKPGRYLAKVGQGSPTCAVKLIAP
jgi:hypothetical protein